MDTEYVICNDLALPITSIVPPLSTNSIVDVMYSIVTVLKNSNVIPNSNVDYIVNVDDIEGWPVNPPPLCLVEPGRMTDTGNDVGSGRFGKVWDVEFTIHLVVTNYYDSAWKDTTIVTSYNTTTGPYEIVDMIINIVDQCFPVNQVGHLTVIELPQFVRIDEIKRYKKAQGYAGIPIVFRCTFQQILPANPLAPLQEPPL